jgi:hypothetical protein
VGLPAADSRAYGTEIPRLATERGRLEFSRFAAALAPTVLPMEDDLAFGTVMGGSTRGADWPPEELTTHDRLLRLLADVRTHSRDCLLADGSREFEATDPAALETQLDALARGYEFRVRYQASPALCTYHATFEVFIPAYLRGVLRDDELQAVGILAVTYDPLDGPGGVMVGPPRWELLTPERA